MSIGDFDSILSEQTKQIKSEITGRTKDIQQSIDKFYSRWNTLKPKQVDDLDRESARDLALKMRDWRAEWNDIEKKVQEMNKDCDHFEMEQVQFENYQSVQEDLGEMEKAWSLFDEFTVDLEVLEKEDWISFRSKLFTF
jgi:dynein heavy chain 2